MAKRLRPLPDRAEIDDDTPLHMQTAARFAFPDGTISALALRNAASRGDLEYEQLGSRVVTTLRWIREWRERNRHPAKLQPPDGRAPHLTEEYMAASKARAYRILGELRSKPKADRDPSARKALGTQGPPRRPTS